MAEHRRQWLASLLVLLLVGACSKPEPTAPLPPLSNELLVRLGSDPAALAEGKQLFLTTCIACHGPLGQGVVGPNLTDGAWLHGSTALEIHAAISKGFPEKGMAPFENLLGPARVRSVAAYVLSLKGKNVPGKPPEGKAE